MTKEIEVVSEVTGSVWKVEARLGETVQEGDCLLVVESMKMEIPVEAPCAGVLTELGVAEGDPVGEGMVVARVRRQA